MSGEELWERTAKALDGGDFSLLDDLLTARSASIIDLLDANGWPQPEANEAFAWACFNGRTTEAEQLLDRGVDPQKSDKTGMPGFHSAASRGHVDTVEMLISRNVPMEQVNMYGGTVLGQTLWSAVNEPHDGQAEAIKLLIEAGAKVEPGTLDWWEQQPIRPADVKKNVANALRADLSSD
jgi:hypothetical protein